ncbi:MAG: hypothetical protein U0T81_10305 [Saprospiraceae bacterium]
MMQPIINPGDLNADAEKTTSRGNCRHLAVGQSIPECHMPVWSTNKSIPFTFSFNNQPVSNFKVSNSGVLTFDVNATTVHSFNVIHSPNAVFGPFRMHNGIDGYCQQ